ncbi:MULTISPECIES: hypothetical protein [Clostridium]|uniref:hypothetical protein n=1 Tax=Clostridium TaxID=1485 RepID=UPI00096A92BE|nr:hypothetical protein [Clostridium perfringens]MDM0678321.1 hypothetical protein [Clostridium perfringens]MDM0998621.1 hypothetical protein [Clostridium perfringens]MDY5099774.1 hypothetical protein [Clostridium sp.]WVM77480.1 hypothetical protein V1680_15690 [Clostridium perfringens]
MVKQSKIKSIKLLGKEDVYNMEVENHHNFSVNGGFIVHNCMDAVRYFVNTILLREESKPYDEKITSKGKGVIKPNRNNRKGGTVF